MSDIIAHKIRLIPTAAQELHFRQACGISRYVYNWALAEWKDQYAMGGKPTWQSIDRLFNFVKKEQYPWVLDISKCIPQSAIEDVGSAFTKFFKKLSGYPKFKKKGKSRDSFYINNEGFSVNVNRIKIAKIGWVKMREPLRFSGKLNGLTISRIADQWYASIQVKIEDWQQNRQANNISGVDLGLTTHSTISTNDGEIQELEGPKALAKNLNRLQKLSRRASRKKKGSANQKKAFAKLARLHNRVTNIRNDFLHKTTTNLCKNNKAIGIEDLNVKGMVRNHKLARHISDAGWGEFRRQLEYKAKRYGSFIHVVDRFYPSTKTCSCCGAVKEKMDLSERIFECSKCGLIMDRDKNAALNLAKQAEIAFGNYALGLAKPEVTPGR